LAIESVNFEHERKKRGTESAKAQHFEVWDPVLVIGPQGQFGWVGANKSLKKVLHALLTSDHGVVGGEILKTLVPNAALRASTLKYLRSDPNLVRFKDEDQAIELLVTGSEIIAFTLKTVKGYLSQPGSPEGIITGGILR